MAANPSIQLGTDGNWAIKEDNLLAYKEDGTRFFNKEFDFTRNTTATFVDQNGLIQESTTNTPRIDFTDDATGHLLLEPQSTNLIRYSEDFSQSNWTKTRCSLGDKVLSPNGTISAYKIIPNTENLKHEITITVSAYTTATVSLFAKAAEKSRLQITKSNWGTTDFDLLNETVTSGTGNIENYGNGWYRLSASYTASPSQSSIYIIVADDDGDVFYSGNNSDGIYFWGIQLEELSYATSYIPTFGSAVTRNAEVCNNSGSAQDFNSEEGVLYAEIAALADDGTFRVISLDDGDNTNVVKFGYRSTSNAIYYEVRSGDVSQAFQIYTTTDVKQFHKVAVLYQQNNFKLFINGVNVLSDTSGVTPVGLNNLSFDVNGYADFYGKTKDLKVFKRAMSDGELYLLTVPQYQSYQEMATALNYTL